LAARNQVRNHIGVAYRGRDFERAFRADDGKRDLALRQEAGSQLGKFGRHFERVAERFGLCPQVATVSMEFQLSGTASRSEHFP